MNQMENPYKPPLQSGVEPDLTSAALPQTFSAALSTGTKVALKWVTIIIAPILALTFLGMVAIVAYRGVNDGNWTDITDSEKRWQLLQLVGLLFAAYAVSCFWACLFSAIAYAICYLFTRRSSMSDPTKIAG